MILGEGGQVLVFFLCICFVQSAKILEVNVKEDITKRRAIGQGLEVRQSGVVVQPWAGLARPARSCEWDSNLCPLQYMTRELPAVDFERGLTGVKGMEREVRNDREKRVFWTLRPVEGTRVE